LSQLITALEQLVPNDHLLLVMREPAEHLVVAIPFIRIGLERSEKCVYIADGGRVAEVRKALACSGHRRYS
jgi:hypothetical protein